MDRDNGWSQVSEGNWIAGTSAYFIGTKQSTLRPKGYMISECRFAFLLKHRGSGPQHSLSQRQMLS